MSYFCNDHKAEMSGHYVAHGHFLPACNLSFIPVMFLLKLYRINCVSSCFKKSFPSSCLIESDRNAVIICNE